MSNFKPVVSGSIPFPYHLPRKHKILSLVIGMALLCGWGGEMLMLKI